MAGWRTKSEGSDDVAADRYVLNAAVGDCQR